MGNDPVDTAFARLAVIFPEPDDRSEQVKQVVLELAAALGYERHATPPIVGLVITK